MRKLAKPTQVVFLAVLLAFIALFAGGAWFYVAQKKALRWQAELQLTGIARGKVEQIVAWRARLMNSAAELSDSPFLYEGVERFLAEPESVNAAELLRQRLRGIATHEHCVDVLLVDQAGHVRLSANGHTETNGEYAAAVANARGTRRPAFIDLRSAGQFPVPHLTVVVPLLGARREISSSGVLVLIMDAAQHLYPMIESWPTPSSTAETLLVRREANRVLFLNNLRYQSNSALKLSIPLTRTDVPAVAGVLGHTGLFEGKDYRGVETVAVVLPIGNSPWVLEAKEDASEVFEVWRIRSALFLALLASLMGGLGAVGIIAQQRDRKAHFRALYLAEAALRATEACNSVILNAIGDGLITTNAEGRVEGLNPVAEALTGWRESEAHGQPLDAVFHIVNEETLEKADDPVAKALRDGAVVMLANHTLLIAKDGSQRPVADSAAPIRDEHGNVVGVVLVFRDQTEERRTQRLLKARLALLEQANRLSAQQLLAKFLDEVGSLLDSPIGFYHFVETDQKTIFLAQWSTRTQSESCRADGTAKHCSVDQAGVWADCVTTREPTIHNDFASLPNRKGMPDGHAEVRREVVVPVLRGGKVVAVVGLGNKPSDYTQKDVETVSYLADVTWQLVEHKRAEERQRESDLRFRAIYESIPTGVAQVTLEFRIQHANPAYCQMLGYVEEELVGKHLREITHPDVVETNLQQQAMLVRGEIDRYQMEKAFVCKDGRIVHGLMVSTLVRDPLGNPLYALGTVVDITERKRSEAERERLIAAVEQVGEVIFITDTKGVIQYVNPAFETVTGYSRDEALGKTPRILKSGKQDAAFYRELWMTISGGKVFQRRLVNRHKNGTLHVEDVTISSVRDAKGNIVNYIAVQRDVTEAVRLAEQIQQAQKMESVGRLAGGIAHDFNNMLGVILGHTEMALAEVDLTTPLRENLSEVQRAAQRSAELTSHLLAFARRQAIAPKVINLDDAVEAMLKMLRRLIGEAIDLAWLPGTGTWRIKMDSSQVDQILANLCVNARDAIDGAGKITIETNIVSLDEAYCADHVGSTPGDYVLLAVSDDGCGMDKDTQSMLFEPFFTTKNLGQGTGLGLSTVYGIVRQNNGFITVYSEPGNGSVFNIYLPRHTGPVGGDETKRSITPTPGQGETVLLVEDEPSILKMVGAMLRRLGYAVLDARGADEANRIVEKHQGAIHLLLTDVVMRGMNGRELAGQLLSMRPNIKCLFMSGYTADVIAHHGVLDKGVDFIQKPFSMHSLAARLRDVLQRE